MNTNNNNNSNSAPGQRNPENASGQPTHRDNNNQDNSAARSNPDNTTDTDLEDPINPAKNPGRSGRQDDVSGRGYQTDNEDAQTQDWESDDMAPDENDDSSQGEQRRESEHSGSGDMTGNQGMRKGPQEENNQQSSDAYGADVDHTADPI